MSNEKKSQQEMWKEMFTKKLSKDDKDKMLKEMFNAKMFSKKDTEEWRKLAYRASRAGLLAMCLLVVIVMALYTVFGIRIAIRDGLYEALHSTLDIIQSTLPLVYEITPELLYGVVGLFLFFGICTVVFGVMSGAYQFDSDTDKMEGDQDGDS